LSDTTIASRPLSLNVDGVPWKVQTYSQTYGGRMNLVRATLASDNTVYAQLILDLGAKNVAETAKLMGITTKLDCYPAEGLGGLTRGVTTLEMANAYATLASGGVRRRATGIERVVHPDGTVDKWAKPEGTRVMTDGQAYEVTQILEQNITDNGDGTLTILVLTTGEWWLERRTMSRATVSRYLSAFVWHALEGATTAAGRPISTYGAPRSAVTELRSQ
jgi:penicillin-binding protein 1A